MITYLSIICSLLVGTVEAQKTDYLKDVPLDRGVSRAFTIPFEALINYSRVALEQAEIKINSSERLNDSTHILIARKRYTADLRLLVIQPQKEVNPVVRIYLSDRRKKKEVTNSKNQWISIFSIIEAKIGLQRTYPRSITHLTEIHRIVPDEIISGADTFKVEIIDEKDSRISFYHWNDPKKQILTVERMGLRYKYGEGYWKGIMTSVSDSLIEFDFGSKFFRVEEVDRIIVIKRENAGVMALGAVIGAGIGLGMATLISDDDGCTDEGLVCFPNTGEMLLSTAVVGLGTGIGVTAGSQSRKTYDIDGTQLKLQKIIPKLGKSLTRPSQK